MIQPGFLVSVGFIVGGEGPSGDSRHTTGMRKADPLHRLRGGVTVAKCQFLSVVSSF